MEFCQLLAGWKLIPDGRASTFYNIHSRRKKLPVEFKQDVSALFAMLKAGKLNPAIADVVPLSQIRSVHERIDKAQIAGKVILRCD